jgi:DNA-directed RNA polymerase specialized sigma24 family protein
MVIVAHLKRSAGAETCQAYWYPVYAHVRHRGYPIEEARDLTQEFFTRLIQHHWLEHADPARGKFRSYLYSALNHFLSNEWRKSHTAKRGGGRPLLSLDCNAENLHAEEAAAGLTPEQLFDRKWLLTIFQVALGKLRLHYQQKGKGPLFDALKPFLSEEVPDHHYDQLGKELSMTHAATSTAVCRLRHRYRDLVREEIARTVSCAEDVDSELHQLLELL